MKANELMIGDWVYNKNITKLMQVYPMMLPQMFRRTPNATTEDYNIYPVPITPEILEKNGFRIIFEGELHTTYSQDIYGFVVEIKIDCIGFTKLSMSNGLGYRVVIECKHVHQLQQALRLCGINKEIVL